MFTGIIEEVGKIKTIIRGKNSAQISIDAEKVLENTKIGDSIAVNGVCLTVTALSHSGFSADVMFETLNRSNLGELTQNALVNLERAMPMNGRFGGHIVSGHIDGTGKISKMQRNDIALVFTIETNSKITDFVIEKGSIAIDGISLTVTEVQKDFFSISAIPHTIANTGLKNKKLGDTVNLESDIIGKYVEKLLLANPEIVANDTEKNEASSGSGITLEFLAKNGF